MATFAFDNSGSSGSAATASTMPAGMLPLGGPAGTVVDPITQQSTVAATNAVVKKNSSPWGNTIPLSLGARAVTGKILWSSDLREVPQPEVASSGSSTTVHYQVDLAVSFGYSGLDPSLRAASQLIHLWAQQIACYDTNDPVLTQAFNGMTVRFHPGLIDAVPDALIVADKGAALTPAWRNQIYVVIQNFPLWQVGLTDGLPDFVAEIFDVTTGEPVVSNYALTSPIVHTSNNNGLAHLQPFWYDPLTSSGYALITPTSGPGATMVKFDLSAGSLVELGRSPVSGGETFSLDATTLAIHDTVNGLVLVVDSTLISNSTPVHLLSLASAKVLTSLGKNSTSLTDVIDKDPAQTQLTYSTEGDVIKTQFLSNTWYGFIVGGEFDQIALLSYKKDGSAMSMTDSVSIGGDTGIGHAANLTSITSYPIIGRTDLKHLPPTTIVPNSGLLPPFNLAAAKQDSFSFIGHGGVLTLLRASTSLPPYDPTAIVTLGFPGPFVTQVNFKVAEMLDVWNVPGGQIKNVWVDPNDHNLVVFWSPVEGGSTYMTKLSITCTDQFTAQGWRPIVGGVLYQVLLPSFVDAGALQFILREYVPSNLFGFFGVDSRFYEMDLSSGQVVSSALVASHSAVNGYIYSGQRGSLEYLNHETDNVEHIKLRSTDAVRMPLAQVITSFMLNAGYTADQFTIDAAINDTVFGAYIDTTADLWQTMANLGIVFDFSYFISGDVVKFSRQPLTDDGVAFSVDLTALTAGTSDPYEAITTMFAAPNELPGNTGVTYLDPDQRYVANTQTFRRTNFPVKVADANNDTTVPVPIVMKSDEALRRSGQATFAQFAKNEVFSFKLPAAYLQAEPVDVIGVTTRQFTYQVLIGEIVFDTDWTLGITGTNRNVRTTNAFRVGPDGNFISPGASPFIVDPVKPPVPLPGTSPSDPLLLDIPLLQFSDDVGPDYAQIYAGAVSKVKKGWVGATVSTEVGTDTWQTFFHSVKSVPMANVGILPPTSTPNQTDTTTVLRVTPLNFDPAIITSVSDDNFRAGKNALVIGGYGRWEVVYFRDAVLNGVVLNLSTLVRGQRGTEGNCNSHSSADFAYFVNLAGVRSGALLAGVPYAQIGQQFSVRARGDNERGDVATGTDTIAGNTLKPFAPCSVKMHLGSLDSGSTAYTNLVGNGPIGAFGISDFSYPSRAALIRVTSNMAADGLFSKLVDGSNLTTSTADAVFFHAGTTDGVLTFDFRPSGYQQIIDEFTISQRTTGQSMGTFQLYGSNDQVTWTLLKPDFNLTGNTTAIAFTNTTPFYFYQLRQTGGTNPGMWVYEFLFKSESYVANAADALITWLRRDRLGQEFVTAEVPMSELFELYDLEIVKDSAIVRTVTGLPNPVYLYTEAQQLADGFTAPLTSLNVRVYQQGTRVARGFVRDVTIYTGAP